jgi:hypothetical protein
VPLVGRDGECTRIQALLDGIDRADAALLVRGEPGIGKSALLEHAAELARPHGASVFSGRSGCTPKERSR